MISGYRMTGSEIRESLRELDKSGGATSEWRFMKFDESLTRDTVPDSMIKLLRVAKYLAFKIWRLWRPLRICAITLGIILAGLLVWLCVQNWNSPIVSIGFGETDGNLWRLTWGAAATTGATIAVVGMLPAFARNFLRLVDYRKTAYEVTVGVAMGLLGWIAAQLHLRVFDKLYLWWGSQKRLLGRKDSQS